MSNSDKAPGKNGSKHSTLGDPDHDRGFDEPWQAQAHAIAQVLLERGHIDKNDWSTMLGAAIRRRLANGEPDTTETYYAALTDAIVEILDVDTANLEQLASAWREAYAHTPHGQPVVLESGSPTQTVG